MSYYSLYDNLLRDASSASIQLEEVGDILSNLRPSTGFGNEFSLEMTEPIASHSIQYTSSTIGGSPSTMADDDENEFTTLQRIFIAVETSFEISPLCKRTNFEPNGCKWEARISNADMVEDLIDKFYLSVVCSKKEESFDFCEDNYTIDLVILPLKNNTGDAWDFDLDADEEEEEYHKEYAIKTFHLFIPVIMKEIGKLKLPQRIVERAMENVNNFYDITDKVIPDCFLYIFRLLINLVLKVSQSNEPTFYRARRHNTRELVLIKAIDRQSLTASDDANLVEEIFILSSLNHPSLIYFHDFFEEPERYLVVTEYASTPLFQEISKNTFLSEKDIRNRVDSLVRVINYCHGKSIAHLDISPENLFIKDDELKLCGLSLAQIIPKSTFLDKPVGNNPLFISPEILQRKKFDASADMWSVGIVLYMLLSGEHPFLPASSIKQLSENISKCEITFSKGNWDNISENAKVFVKKLLMFHPTTRITARKCLIDKWINMDEQILSKNDLSQSAYLLRLWNAQQQQREQVFNASWCSNDSK